MPSFGRHVRFRIPARPRGIHLRGGVPPGHGRCVRHVAGAQLRRRHRRHRRAGHRHRRRVTARHAVLRGHHGRVGREGDGAGVSGIGGGRGAGRHGRQRRVLVLRGRQRGAWRSGRGRHAADDHRRRRHGLVVHRLYGTVAAAVATRRPVGGRGLSRHDDRLRVPALVARVVLSERTAVVLGPATSAIAV